MTEPTLSELVAHWSLPRGGKRACRSCGAEVDDDPAALAAHLCWRPGSRSPRGDWLHNTVSLTMAAGSLVLLGWAGLSGNGTLWGVGIVAVAATILVATKGRLSI
jgi:hypothetical protein